MGRRISLSASKNLLCRSGPAASRARLPLAQYLTLQPRCENRARQAPGGRYSTERFAALSTCSGVSSTTVFTVALQPR